MGRTSTVLFYMHKLAAARLERGTAQRFRLANSARILINMCWYYYAILFYLQVRLPAGTPAGTNRGVYDLQVRTGVFMNLFYLFYLQVRTGVFMNLFYLQVRTGVFINLFYLQVRTGVFMNLFSVLVVVLGVSTWTSAILDITDVYPDWAKETNVTAG